MAPPVAASPVSAEAPAPPQDDRPGRRGRWPGSEPAAPEQAARVKGALSSSDGWFESGRMEDAKR
jgi:hypothetical protein